jgi:hypothetical protein
MSRLVDENRCEFDNTVEIAAAKNVAHIAEYLGKLLLEASFAGISLFISTDN